MLLFVGCAEQAELLGGGSQDSGFDQNIYDAVVADSESVEMGGQLYDKWWTALDQNTPFNLPRNPIWADSQGNANPSSPDTWRCKECHGWDYRGESGAYGDPGSSHYTGFEGILSAVNKPAEELFAFIKNGTTPGGKPHRYQDVLEDEAIYQLTAFIKSEVSFIGNFGAGDSSTGQFLFDNDTSRTAACGGSSCHASISMQDTAIAVATENPQEFVHKVRFGHPGSLMPGGLSRNQALDVLRYVVDVLGGGGTGTLPDPQEPSVFNLTSYNATNNAETFAKGGLLWDKWWVAGSQSNGSSLSEPAVNHPRWPNGNVAVQDGSTWRCKECHGWDYRGKDGAYRSGKHFTGIQGIVSLPGSPTKANTAQEIFDWIRSGPQHDFGGSGANKLSDDDIYALTRFVENIRNLSVKPYDYIDDASKRMKNTNASLGATAYANGPGNCKTCHGADGTALNFGDDVNPEYLADLAVDNPWETIHKALFGHPGSTPTMPPMVIDTEATATTLRTAANVLAYIQEDLGGGSAIAGNVARGARLYDKWWAELSATAPGTYQPRYQNLIGNGVVTTPQSEANSWRCKECHGWDYQGVDGAYGNPTSSHYTGIAGLKNRTLRTDAASMKTFISSGLNHSFVGQGMLSDADVDDLVAFIETVIDGDPAQPPTGNASSGATLYQSSTPGNCEFCHGIDGNTIPNVNLNDIANTNEPEFLHKARFGHPGSEMVPTTGATGYKGLDLAEAANVLAYAKTLTSVSPGYANASAINGGLLYDKWYKQLNIALETDANSTVVINPLWEIRSDPDFINVSAGKEDYTWRCKQCHGWDYSGDKRANNGLGLGFDNDLLYLRGIRDWTPDYLYNILNTGFSATVNGVRTQVHNYGDIITRETGNSQPIWDLVKFLMEGVIDTAKYIRSTGDPIGDAINGQGLYTGSSNTSNNCQACHGADGASLTDPDTGEPIVLDIFQIAKENPWEFLHKARFGQPATPMPGVEGMTFSDGTPLTTQDAADILKYAVEQTPTIP